MSKESNLQVGLDGLLADFGGNESECVVYDFFVLHIPFKPGNIVDSGAVFSDALAATVPGDRIEYLLFSTTSYLLAVNAFAFFIMLLAGC